MRSLVLILFLLSGCAYPVGVREANGVTTWYPAQSGGELMRFRDYVPRLEDADMILHARGVSDEKIVDLFDTIMLARRNAPPRSGAFTTLTIVRKPNETAADHAFLAEHLAQRGYIVRLADDAQGTQILTGRVSSWDFAVDKEKAQQELERVLQGRPEASGGRATGPDPFGWPSLRDTAPQSRHCVAEARPTNGVRGS